MLPEMINKTVDRHAAKNTIHLVASLASDAANRKTLELIAEHGPAPENLEPLFAALESAGGSRRRSGQQQHAAGGRTATST